MFLLELLVCSAIVVFFIVIATQVIVPLYSGEPMFPIFRKSVVKSEIGKAEKTLETVAEAAHLKQLADEIERRTSALNKDSK